MIAKRLLLVVVVAAFTTLAAIGAGSPAPARASDGHDGAPAGAKLVLNVTYRVTNDEDSGVVGYWALDNYRKTVQVWQTAPGTFFVVARYDGTWTTFAGALSPENGITEAAGASGPLEGGYTATFNGTLTTGALKTHGEIAASDCGGTRADIVLGTYGNGQVGPTSCFSWLAAYFPGYTGFTYGNGGTDWSWTYRYQDQRWVNAGAGNTGDIVITGGSRHDGDHHDGGHDADGRVGGPHRD